MKHAKRILALIGVIILFFMYLSTLIFALMDSPNTMGFFKASIACTIFIPVLLYAIMLFAKLGKNDDPFPEEDEKEDNDEGEA